MPLPGAKARAVFLQAKQAHGESNPKTLPIPTTTISEIS